MKSCVIKIVFLFVIGIGIVVVLVFLYVVMFKIMKVYYIDVG